MKRKTVRQKSYIKAATKPKSVFTVNISIRVLCEDAIGIQAQHYASRVASTILEMGPSSLLEAWLQYHVIRGNAKFNSKKGRFEPAEPQDLPHILIVGQPPSDYNIEQVITYNDKSGKITGSFDHLEMGKAWETQVEGYTGKSPRGKRKVVNEL
jgi:hypothetical protein